MNLKQQNKEIKRLSRALSEKDRALLRQRRENARLKRELAALRGAYGHDGGTVTDKKDGSDTNEAQKERDVLLRMGAVNARRFAKKSYLRYLIHSIKESALGSFFKRAVLIFRRLRLVRIVATVVASLLVTLFLSALFITILPFLLLLGIGALVAVMIGARAANRKMTQALSGKRVRIMILSDGASLRDDSFAKRSARDMARDPDVAILVVSPHLLSPRGLGGKGMYFTVRKEAVGLFLVRRSYYFILRRRVLDGVCEDITVIY